MNELIRIHPSDSVAVALRPLKAGASVPVSGAGSSVTLREDIAMGHKAALKDIAAGEKVIKYGFPIGEATAAIPRGGHVHSHNLRTLLSSGLTYAYHPTHPSLPKGAPAAFSGYPRADGRAGIRNELWIIPTVGCVNDVAEALAKKAQSLTGGSVENVRALPHPYGCSQLGDDQEHTRTVLARFAAHPNAGGVLVLGLGCENSGIEEIRKRMGDPSGGPLAGYDPERVRFLISQDVEDEVEEGFRLLQELAARMQKDVRVPCDTSKLVVGLKCGGSDGLSGITANPTIGGFSDLLIARGGSTILTEVPEMFGAETILMDRCEDSAVFEKTVKLINDFKAYFESCGQPVYENPSPGNKAGGITTLEDKALGCTQKSGTAPVVDVLPYGGRVTKPGLSLLSAPGNDLVASTALAAAGAQVVLFSTGRGTPFGCPVPTIKISSNSALAAHKAKWIDFDAGTLVEGGTLPERAQALFDFVLEVAGGKRTHNEENGFQGMAIFKTGTTL
ncbi:MAG: altronate dehydratase family protein [Fretibacterium sp.]|nr:altronate dehydratase family protein [Fretibacterium sp.]